MTCILCRWIMRWLAHEDPVFADELARFWKGVREGGNTAAIFNADADPGRLRELAALADPGEAFLQFLALAEAGSVWSMLRVASTYATGEGVSLDLAEAERWYARAGDAGADHGLLRSADLAFRRGDLAAARAILMAGAERGLTRALTALADMELKAGLMTEARAHYEQAIARADFAAEANLARAMVRGALGWRYLPQGIRRASRAVRHAVSEVEARSARRTA